MHNVIPDDLRSISCDSNVCDSRGGAADPVVGGEAEPGRGPAQLQGHLRLHGQARPRDQPARGQVSLL